MAAFSSRSCRVPQAGHVQWRVPRLKPVRRCPHAEQVFELGYQRSITIRRRPALAVLYSNRRRKVPHPESEMALARDRLRTIVLHGEVFDHDHVVVADQGGAGLVEEVRPGGADLAVGSGDLRPGLGPVRGTSPLAGHHRLVAGQSPLPAGQGLRVGEVLAVGGDGEVLQPEVDPHSSTGRCALGRIEAGPRPHDLQRRALFRELQAPAAPPEPRPGVLRRLAAGAGLEPRVPGALGETPIQQQDQLPLPCSAGVRFLPGLKAGVSSEEFR